MHYKRKGHRGRHKKNTMDNNSCRVVGNSRSKASYSYAPGARRSTMGHQSASHRNRVSVDEVDD